MTLPQQWQLYEVGGEEAAKCIILSESVEIEGGGRLSGGSGQRKPNGPCPQPTNYSLRHCSLVSSPLLPLLTMVIGKWISFSQPPSALSDTPLPQPIPVPCTADGKQFGLENVRLSTFTPHLLSDQSSS